MLNTNTCFLYFPLISNTLRTLHTLYLILQWTFLLSDAYCQCVLAQCWEVWTSFYRNGLRRCLTLFWNPDYWLFWLYLHIFMSNLTIFPVVVVNLIQHWRRWIEEKTVWMQKGRRRSWFLWDVSVTHTHILSKYAKIKSYPLGHISCLERRASTWPLRWLYPHWALEETWRNKEVRQ